MVAIDSTSVRTHSNPNRKTISDPEARWGVKHSAKAQEGGTEYFFGYKSHAVADAVYGIPLAQVVTAGNRNDSPVLPEVMEKARSLHSWWSPRVALADRGYDSNDNHNWLDARGVVPIIHIRRPANAKLYDGIYTSKGVPTCLGGVPMEYTRTDPATGHHLYKCPTGGCHLKGWHRGTLHCDSEVWEDPATNIRLFGKIRRASPEMEGPLPEAVRNRKGVQGHERVQAAGAPLCPGAAADRPPCLDVHPGVSDDGPRVGSGRTIRVDALASQEGGLTEPTLFPRACIALGDLVQCSTLQQSPTGNPQYLMRLHRA